MRNFPSRDNHLLPRKTSTDFKNNIWVTSSCCFLCNDFIYISLCSWIIAAIIEAGRLLHKLKEEEKESSVGSWEEMTKELQSEETKSHFKPSIWRFGLQPLFATAKAANSPNHLSAKHKQVIVGTAQQRMREQNLNLSYLILKSSL